MSIIGFKHRKCLFLHQINNVANHKSGGLGQILQSMSIDSWIEESGQDLQEHLQSSIFNPDQLKIFESG